MIFVIGTQRFAGRISAGVLGKQRELAWRILFKSNMDANWFQKMLDAGIRVIFFRWRFGKLLATSVKKR